MKRRRKKRPVIDRQFEYNQFIRDYYNNNNKPSLKDAIAAWNEVKSNKGDNTYAANQVLLNLKK